MTFLFGIFFPSYQAYAKGNNTFATMQKVQLNTKLNDDLVNKLASSKTFEAYYYSLFTLAMYSALSLSNKSEKQLEQVSLQLEQIVDKKDNNINNVYAALGLEVDKAFTLKTDELQVKLKNEFPALTVMDENQIKEVVNRAILKGDLEAKAIAFGAKDECFNTAAKEYTKCTSGSRWWSAAAGIACVVCVVALVACLGATALVTDGGSLAFAASLLPYTRACVVTTLTMFGLSAEFNSTCDSQNKVRVESCATAHGTFAAGGGE